MASRERRLLGVILGLYLLLGIAYSVGVPVFEASDELSHYPLVQHLATRGLALPVLDPANPGPWKQEGGQPPLYYFLAALGTSAIDTSDFAAVYQLNPHADIGLVPPDGNINMVVHDAAREAFPWRGTILAVHVARLLSVLMGAVTVLTTYLIGREVFPALPGVALTAAALNAFLPMFLFISGSVNNDNLSNMVAGLLLWRVVKLIKRETLPDYGTYLVLGGLAAVALLAKLSLGLLVLFVAAALLALSLRLRDWQPVVIGGAISGGIAILGAGWWYLRNWGLYGDPTALNAFLGVVGQRAVPADLWQLWTEQESFLRSWWGVFGGMNVLLPDRVYAALNVIGGLGLAGFGAYLIMRAAGKVRPEWQGSGRALLVATLWPFVAWISLWGWSRVTWASQGRLLFIAIGPVCLWLAVGLGWLLSAGGRRVIWTAATALLLGVAVLALPLVILPAYALPDLNAQFPDDPGGAAQEFYEPGAADPALRLRGYEVAEDALRPGETVTLTLYWEALARPTRRWSLFMHVLDGADAIIAQRDRYPGQGLLATEVLQPDQSWIETVAIRVPGIAYTPDSLRLAVGLYDRATGERMVLEPGGATLHLLDARIALEPPAPEAGLPNPRADNFANLIGLRGYDVSGRRLSAGEPLTVTLYWEARQSIPRDYTVFVHVIDTPSLAIYAGSDAQPAGGARPTSGWAVGEVIEDVHTLAFDPQTPPGTYDIEVGLYWMPEQGVFERLNVLAERGGLAATVVYLSRVRVAAAESESP